MIARFFKTLIGILLLPLAIGTAKAFYTEIGTLSIFSGSFRLLERGVLAYLLFHCLVMRPAYIYVLGHECVHVIAAWLCGGKVVSFNVTPSGGSVVTSKTNFFIELSPYFIPIYTVLLGPIFVALDMAGKVSPSLSATFLFLVGVTLAFHVVLTTEVLKVKQPDIMRSGIVFSSIVIFVGNLVITMGVFCLLFDGLSFVTFLKNSWLYIGETYQFAYAKTLVFVQSQGLLQG